MCIGIGLMLVEAGHYKYYKKTETVLVKRIMVITVVREGAQRRSQPVAKRCRPHHSFLPAGALF